MSDPTPIAVPEALRPLVDHAPDTLEALRTMRLDLERLSGLDERSIELVRMGAAVAQRAPRATHVAHVKRALAIGMTKDEIWGAVMAVAPLVGVPALLDAIPSIAAGLEEAE